MKKTAVNWLFDNLSKVQKDKIIWHVILLEAQKIEKKNMIDFANGFWNWAKGGQWDKSDVEQYYNETYDK